MSTTETTRESEPARTNMRLHKGDDWPVRADVYHADEGTCSYEDHATLRRVGWLDQKGRVWTYVPSSLDFDGGSLTPLLIDARQS